MIILSVGHDKRRQGARHNGVSEWGLASRLVALIDHPDIVVIDRALADTVQVINNWPEPVELAAELHFNSHPRAEGCETLYCPGSGAGKDAAEAFQDSFLDGLAMHDRGVKEGWYKMKVNTFIDYFLQATSMPAIILEPEFIQVASDWQSAWINTAAKRITNALLEARKAL
jgi:N-acetylmuramoyl-L-alanine amidase